MGKQTVLELSVPVDIGSAGWAQKILKSYLHNAKIIYKRENKKLLSEVEAHGRKIYDLVIAAFYASYHPLYYDRHGDRRGFNLYSANSFIANNDDGVLYDFSTQWIHLLPYYSFWQMKQYDKNKGLERRGFSRLKVFLMVLNGQRNFIKYRRSKNGFTIRDDDNNAIPYIKKVLYKFDVNYPPLKKHFKGKPYQILSDATNQLVKYYNYQIIKRISTGISNMPIRWVE